MRCNTVWYGWWNLFTWHRDCGRQICMHTSGRKNLPIVSSGSASSHQWEIEVGWYARNSLEKKKLPIVSSGSAFEEDYVCHCTVFYEIRGRYHCLFKQGLLCNAMEYEEQWCSEHSCYSEMLKDNIATKTAHWQETIMTFFNSITPSRATSQLWMKEVWSRPRL